MTTTIVHNRARVVQARQKGVRGYVNIARPTRWGNKYRTTDVDPHTGECEPLQHILWKYEQWLRAQIIIDSDFRAAFFALRGQTLGCPCPGAKADPADGEQCHGHVMARVLEEIGENAR